AGLLAIGLKPGKPVQMGSQYDYGPATGNRQFTAPATGDKVYVYVEWKDGDGAVRLARAEDWVWEVKAERPMRRIAWVYAGSFMQEVLPGEGGTYAADYIKSLVTTYNDPTTILENPLPEGRDDTLYYSNEKAVPTPQTPVKAIFSPVELP